MSDNTFGGQNVYAMGALDFNKIRTMSTKIDFNIDLFERTVNLAITF